MISYTVFWYKLNPIALESVPSTARVLKPAASLKSPSDSRPPDSRRLTMDPLEASRRTKLDQIAALGVDPWGARFDGRTPIGAIREMTYPEDPMTGPQLRAAGRV